MIHCGSLQKMLAALFKLVYNTQKTTWANIFEYQDKMFLKVFRLYFIYVDSVFCHSYFGGYLSCNHACDCFICNHAVRSFCSPYASDSFCMEFVCETVFMVFMHLVLSAVLMLSLFGKETELQSSSSS